MPVLRKRHGLLLTISGPAGSGKTTLCNRLVQSYAPSLTRVVTATTRTPREGEVAGVDYHFLSAAEFEEKISGNAFLEDAVVHGRRYGVLRSEVIEKMDAGLDLVINLDVQGAATFRIVAEKDPALGNSLISLFLMPSNLEVMRKRLVGRDTDEEEEIDRRLVVAQQEIARWVEYDYCFVSGSKDEDFAQAKSIYEAELTRVTRLVEEQ